MPRGSLTSFMQRRNVFALSSSPLPLRHTACPRLFTCRYPLDFTFDPSDEDEGEEDMLRQQLRKHLVNAVRQAPELVLDFLCRALSSLPTPLSALPFPDLEAALRLIFHFGEGCGGMTGLNSGNSAAGGVRRTAAAGSSAAGPAELLRSGAFPQMVLALHESDVMRHNHPQVRRLSWLGWSLVRLSFACRPFRALRVAN